MQVLVNICISQTAVRGELCRRWLHLRFQMVYIFYIAHSIHDIGSTYSSFMSEASTDKRVTRLQDGAGYFLLFEK